MSTNTTTHVKADASTDEFPLAEYAISPKTVKRAQWENLQVAACQGTNHRNVCNYSHGGEEKADHTHTVTIENGMPVECTCGAFTYNNGLCKHCLACANAPAAIETAESTPNRPKRTTPRLRQRSQTVARPLIPSETSSAPATATTAMTRDGRRRATRALAVSTISLGCLLR
jgi:hypothetical protein